MENSNISIDWITTICILVFFLGFYTRRIYINFTKKINKYKEELENDVETVKDYIRKMETYTENKNKGYLDFDQYLVEMYSLLKDGIEKDLKTELGKRKLMELIFELTSLEFNKEGYTEEQIFEKLNEMLHKRPWLRIQDISFYNLLKKMQKDIKK